MELKIKEINFPEVISFNFEELKTEITTKAALYKNMVYTDDTIKEAKADKAALNKFITALEDTRKEVKKQCLQPYEEFEKQIKELVAIINEPVQLIDSQVKAYEDKQKAEKLEQIKEIWETTEHPEWLQCKQIFDLRWLNTTFSLKKVKEAIDERLAQIVADIKTLESLPEYSFEAIESYKQTLDLNRAISEGQRLADIQRRKKEQQARLAEQQAQEGYAEPQPESTMPAGQSDEMRTWIKFEAYLSVREAKELNSYLKSRNIEIRAI